MSVPLQALTVDMSGPLTRRAPVMFGDILLVHVPVPVWWRVLRLPPRIVTAFQVRAILAAEFRAVAHQARKIATFPRLGREAVAHANKVSELLHELDADPSRAQQVYEKYRQFAPYARPVVVCTRTTNNQVVITAPLPTPTAPDAQVSPAVEDALPTITGQDTQERSVQDAVRPAKGHATW